jgi:hypothetical protein
MILVAIRAHEKAWCLFAAEWTQSFKTTASTLEGDVFSNHVLDVQFCPHLLLGVHRFIISLFTSVIACG